MPKLTIERFKGKKEVCLLLIYQNKVILIFLFFAIIPLIYVFLPTWEQVNGSSFTLFYICSGGSASYYTLLLLSSPSSAFLL